MKKTVTAIIMIACFVLCNAAQMEEHTDNDHDSLIVSVLEQLNVPYLPRNISDTEFAPFHIVGDSGLTLHDTFSTDRGTVELYEGHEKDYLAVLRNGDSIYCAQYVNDCVIDNIDIDNYDYEYLFFHWYEVYGTGVYYRSKYAFLMDGNCLWVWYAMPQDTVPLFIEIGGHAMSLLPSGNESLP